MRHQMAQLLLSAILLLLIATPAGAVVLSTTTVGEGEVHPPVGAHDYARGTTVTLTATPAPGWLFDHWEGSVLGNTNPLQLQIGWTQQVTAVFRPRVATPENQLARYVGRFDPEYTWEKHGTDEHFGWTKHTLRLVSQQWRDGSEVDHPVWEHDLGIIEPWFSNDQAILFINGGSNHAGPPEEVDGDLAAAALLIGMKYVQLDQVPNQPLVFSDDGGRQRSEDEILAYSLDKAITTGDLEWPVHLAMTKAVVRAMDAVQERLPGIDEFLLVGGSKRGWTTYLAAAVDPRVTAMVPASIDIGNLLENVRHHFESYGFYTPAVQDYAEFDLFCRLAQPGGIEVATIVDPLTYAAKYTMPKLLGNSAGDQFFPPDSSRFYWPQLPGPKWMRYTVNTDHSQAQDDTAILALLSAGDKMMDGEPLPDVTWNIDNGWISVQSNTAPLAVKLWQAHNPTARDFRLEAIGAAWSSTPLQDQGNHSYKAYVPEPAQGWTAFLVELVFADGIILSTQPAVVPDTLPFKGMACR